MREVDSPKAKTEGEKQAEKILSPSQPARLTAPSSEGAFWRIPAKECNRSFTRGEGLLIGILDELPQQFFRSLMVELSVELHIRAFAAHAHTTRKLQRYLSFGSGAKLFRAGGKPGVFAAVRTCAKAKLVGVPQPQRGDAFDNRLQKAYLHAVAFCHRAQAGQGNAASAFKLDLPKKTHQRRLILGRTLGFVIINGFFQRPSHNCHLLVFVSIT